MRRIVATAALALGVVLTPTLGACGSETADQLSGLGVNSEAMAEQTVTAALQSVGVNNVEVDITSLNPTEGTAVISPDNAKCKRTMQITGVTPPQFTYKGKDVTLVSLLDTVAATAVCRQIAGNPIITGGGANN